LSTSRRPPCCRRSADVSRFNLPPARADKARKAARKGKTLQQIEAEEGGPVKESMVGMAQSKRAAKRKAGRVVDDTDLVEDVEGVEEELEQEEEDGIKLEAFNLKASGGGREGAWGLVRGGGKGTGAHDWGQGNEAASRERGGAGCDTLRQGDSPWQQ
jgi:hypothetical protein